MRFRLLRRDVSRERDKDKRPRRSPAMEQFFRAKEDYPDALIFFRMGDFYELFYEDAAQASAMLELTLTSRGSDAEGVPIPMAGVPYHAVAGYIARLIDQGQRVAICEQMEDPSKVKGIVPRAVVRVITPALALDSDAVDARRPNFLVAIVPEGTRFGFAVLELGAAEVSTTLFESESELLAELSRTEPREILLHAGANALSKTVSRILPKVALRTTEAAFLERAHNEPQIEKVLALYEEPQSLAAASCDAVRLILRYTLDAQPTAALDIQRLLPYDTANVLRLDEAAVRNLELVQTLGGERKGSLLALIDDTQSAMGARLLRRRLLAPLSRVDAIRRRHDAVQVFVESRELRARLRAALTRVGDMERLATRASLGVANPRDLGAVRAGLHQAAEIHGILAEFAAHSVDDVLTRLQPPELCDDVRELLTSCLEDELPLVATQAGIFRTGHDPRIDELRELSTSSKDVILRLEERERARTGISTLKIRYTKVFGYYIEITRSKAGSVPPEYRRKQTVVSGERFTTDELETVQAKIVNADERLRAIEQDLFIELRARVGAQAGRLRRLAAALADLDVHTTLADVAHRHDYVRPTVDDSLELELTEARHPVVEVMVARGNYVPNDVRLDVDKRRLMVITGPNMAGKSTTMRQTALAVILAQLGGFVPAAQARIGVCDRVFTRVGASDNLAAGQSTFMIEMQETANILRGASRRSLVILDEIGRGTSTYDGLSIAWAVAEHLHDVVQCRAMFATHYHELCDLADVRSGVVNYNVAAREHGEDVVFLHRLLPGAANRSYGIAVARLSGIPEIVLARARAILRALETGETSASGQKLRSGDTHSAQLSMFEPVSALPPPSVCETTLRELDIERMTPLDALNALARLKALLPPE
ncbi:MAG TPA: DNA mismatch repair protein MutS [Polyangiales bacterium]|nr:DNA mismatch repair protein MutS [Polyangiales bacterium]